MLQTAIKVFNTLKNTVQKVYHILHLEKHETKKGRKEIIHPIDAITLFLFKQKQNIETKKSLFEIMELPCSYKTLVVSLNRIAPLLAKIIAVMLAMNGKSAHWLKHTDSTDIPVSLVKNAKHHKTMLGLAAWSKTGKGWFYGLKLHLSSDVKGRVLALCITSGNSNDRAIFKKMNEKLRGIFVADAGYISKELERDFFIENERMLFTIPRSKMRKLVTAFQYACMQTRMKIEIHFRVLKMFFGLVTSLPRSIDGYLTHYLASTCSYLLA